MIPLIRRYKTNLTPKECRARIRENVDLISVGFYEKFLGWTLLNLFLISYRSGRIRFKDPIFNKIMGTIRRKNGVTYVRFIKFRGLTDPLSLLLVFLGSYFITWIETEGQLQAMQVAGLSLLCCLFVGLLTFVFTSLLIEGQEGEERLVEFIEGLLELERL